MDDPSVSGSSVVRVGGLRAEVLLGLRLKRTAEMANEVCVIQGELDRTTARLADVLYVEIGHVNDPKLRHQLVELRRRVRDGRRLSASLIAAACRGVSEEANASLGRWLSLRSRRDDLVTQAGEILERELGASRSHLYRVAEDSTLLDGLVLASPDLYTDLLRSAERRTQQGDRRLELGVVRYLSRAAVKTSPYSTFTALAGATWHTDGPAVAIEGDLARRTSHVEIDWGIARSIADAISRWPEIRTQARLALNPTLARDGQEVRFVSWQWQHGEALRRVIMTPRLHAVLEQMRCSRTYCSLVTGLAAGQDVAPSKRYVDQLIEVGLLHVDLGIADRQLTDLTHLKQVLSRAGTERARRARSLIETLASLLTRIGSHGDPRGRAATRSLIHETLTSIASTISATPMVFPTKNAFFENTVVEATVTCGITAWGDVVRSLTAVRVLAPIYEPMLPARLALADWFRGRWPRSGGRILEMYERLEREAVADRNSEAGRLVRMLEFPDGAVPLGAHQGSAIELSRHRVSELLAPKGQAEIVVDGDELAAAIGEPPDAFRSTSSLAFFCQETGDRRAVVNAISPGYGRAIGRLARYRQSLRLAPTTSRSPGWERSAEVGGVFGSNMNLQWHRAAYEISYPGCVSDRPADQRVALDELRVALDNESGMLELIRGRDQRLRLVHLGWMSHAWMPPLCRLLLATLAEGGTSPLASLRRLRVAEPQVGDVLHYPRIVVGAVVLDRRRWIFPPAAVPSRADGGRFDRFRKLSAWRHTYGIPSQCFVRSFGTEWTFVLARKPQFIDLESELFIQVLEHIVQGTKRPIVVEEALPTIESTGTSTDGYAAEWVIELGTAS